jgi:hypothetical protein
MYDLTDEEKTEVTEMLSLLEQNELSLFGTKTTAIEKIMIEKFGEEIVNNKKFKKQSFELLADELNINPEELKTNLSLREALIQILAKQDVSLEGLRALLEKITSPEKKKILLQTFCPSFRLNELLNKGLVTKDSADKIIVDFLRKNAPKLDLGTLDGDKKDQLFIEIRKNIDLPVSALFDDLNVVNILFKETNFIDLLNHINSFQQSARSDMKIGQAKSLEDLMVVLQNDINLRSKENPLQCKLENAENLRDNSVVKIAHKNEKGEDYVFLVWIRSIGNDGTMVVQNIATEGGYRK